MHDTMHVHIHCRYVKCAFVAVVVICLKSLSGPHTTNIVRQEEPTNLLWTRTRLFL